MDLKPAAHRARESAHPWPYAEATVTLVQEPASGAATAIRTEPVGRSCSASTPSPSQHLNDRFCPSLSRGLVHLPTAEPLDVVFAHFALGRPQQLVHESRPTNSGHAIFPFRLCAASCGQGGKTLRMHAQRDQRAGRKAAPVAHLPMGRRSEHRADAARS